MDRTLGTSLGSFMLYYCLLLVVVFVNVPLFCICLISLVAPRYLHTSTVYFLHGLSACFTIAALWHCSQLLLLLLYKRKNITNMAGWQTDTRKTVQLNNLSKMQFSNMPLLRLSYSRRRLLMSVGSPGFSSHGGKGISIRSPLVSSGASPR